MAQMLAPSVQRGSAWPSLKPSATHERRGLASGTGARAQVLTGALAPRSPVSSSSPAAAMTAAATVSAAVTETASSSAGTAASQPVANKHDTSTSIWGSGPAAPRSTRGSGADTPASHDNSSRRDSIQNMFLSALASSGPAPFGPMFTPPLLAGAGAGGLAVDGPGYLTSGSAAASAAWQPRRHLSNTSAAALPTLRVPARSSPSQQSRSAGGASSTQQQRESQPAASPSSPSAAAAEFVAAATNQAAAATAAAIRTAIQAAAAVGAAGGAAPDIHIHGGWLGVARQVAAGLSALSFVSALSVTVVCGAIKAAAAVSGPAVVYAATSGAAGASSGAAVTLHVFGAPPAYAVAAAVAGVLLGLVVSAVDAAWARRSSSGGSGNGTWSAAA